jgi:hypothetical protein
MIGDKESVKERDDMLASLMNHLLLKKNKQLLLLS